MNSLQVLAEQLRSEETPISPHVVDPAEPPELGELTGSAEYALVIEAVREGYLLHYGEPRIFAGMDPDLRLLAGDALYALGLSRVAELGDLAAVAELADLIAATARAQAEGDREQAEALWPESAERLA